MRNSKYILTVTILTLMLSLQFGCSKKNSNSVDDYLDKYEKVVETYEQKIESGSMSISDIQEINDAQTQLLAEENEIDEKWTDAQTDRLQALATRLTKAITKMSSNNFEFK